MGGAVKVMNLIYIVRQFSDLIAERYGIMAVIDNFTSSLFNQQLYIACYPLQPHAWQS